LRLRNVTFANWLRGHGQKDPEERWLRELYPWPVLAQVECDAEHVGRPQRIVYDGVDYEVTLKSVRLQAKHDTYKYRLLVESEGLGWHSRSYSDEFDMCGAPDGSFVTLFHAKTEEPLEKIARAFFSRRWADLSFDSFKTLAVSRFLAASIVGQVAEEAFRAIPLTHYPEARLIGGAAPMLASGRDLWVGYRFFSEDAYDWEDAALGAHREWSHSISRTPSISSRPTCRPALRSNRSPSLTRLNLVGDTRTSFAPCSAGLNSRPRLLVQINLRRSS